jgi:DNA invertase Pin-like site-specific DNA recombinase
MIVTAIGYARVSTRDQNPALQHDALTEAGCVRVFTDSASGAKADRPQLAAALDHVRPSDVLTVWQLDRLGRNMRHLIDTVDALHDHGVQLRSLRENVDTTTASGKLTFRLFAPSPSSDATRRANAPPRLGSHRLYPGPRPRWWRPRKMTPEKVAVARQRCDSQQYTVEQIAQTLGVTRGTVYAHLDRSAA